MLFENKIFLPPSFRLISFANTGRLEGTALNTQMFLKPHLYMSTLVWQNLPLVFSYFFLLLMCSLSYFSISQHAVRTDVMPHISTLFNLQAETAAIYPPSAFASLWKNSTPSRIGLKAEKMSLNRKISLQYLLWWHYRRPLKQFVMCTGSARVAPLNIKRCSEGWVAMALRQSLICSTLQKQQIPKIHWQADEKRKITSHVYRL